MLLGVGRHRYETESAWDSVHNYYEQMVIDQLQRSSERAQTDQEFLADVACVALNRLPPRYVRHDVDMTFFLTPDELDAMIDKVVYAVNEAVKYVESREKEQQEADELEKQKEEAAAAEEEANTDSETPAQETETVDEVDTKEGD